MADAVYRDSMTPAEIAALLEEAAKDIKFVYGILSIPYDKNAVDEQVARFRAAAASLREAQEQPLRCVMCPKLLSPFCAKHQPKPAQAPPLVEAVEALVKAAEAAAQGIREAAEIGIPAHRDYATAVFEALSALREAQRVPVAWDRATDRRKHCDACDGSDAMMPRRVAPPPPVDVAAWLEARAAESRQTEADLSLPATVREMAMDTAECLESAAAAYRREHGGR